MSKALPKLALYHQPLCPYCAVTRETITQLQLDVELRDTAFNSQFRKELIAQGGKKQVPCLRIAQQDGQTEWMYESKDIIDYLKNYQGAINRAA